MKFEGEVAAIKVIIELGKKYGYGNMIAWLNTAWAKQLMEDYNWTWDQACQSVHGTTYVENSLERLNSKE